MDAVIALLQIMIMVLGALTLETHDQTEVAIATISAYQLDSTPGHWAIHLGGAMKFGRHLIDGSLRACIEMNPSVFLWIRMYVEDTISVFGHVCLTFFAIVFIIAISVAVTYRLTPRPWYARFICHHKLSVNVPTHTHTPAQKNSLSFARRVPSQKAPPPWSDHARITPH
eukprot:2395198-Amphidinium_carterae.1